MLTHSSRILTFDLSFQVFVCMRVALEPSYQADGPRSYFLVNKSQVSGVVTGLPVPRFPFVCSKNCKVASCFSFSDTCISVSLTCLCSHCKYWMSSSLHSHFSTHFFILSISQRKACLEKVLTMNLRGGFLQGCFSFLLTAANRYTWVMCYDAACNCRHQGNEMRVFLQP